MTHPIHQEQNPEIWKPEGMPEWKIGDLVRWRISSECDWKCIHCRFNRHDAYPGEGEGVIKYLRDPDNLLKCSECFDVSPFGPQHTYGVSVLEESPGHPEYRGFWAAASELTLLSDEGRER